MEAVLLFFIIAWILAAVSGTVIWRLAKRWPRVPRVLIASYITALLAAPSFVAGHGIAPVPLLFQLIAQPSIFERYIAIAFAFTWTLTFLIFFIISIFARPE